MITAKPNWILVAIGLGLVLLAMFAARLGFFIIDEVLYVFAAETFAGSRTFILENGLHLSDSADLLLTNLLSRGPNGITSQYPPGTAIVWAPLVEFFGIRGIIVFNAVALVGSVFATFALARHMFHDDRVALLGSLLFLFGTFALEYGFVIWPHTISVWTMTAAFLYLLRALESEEGALRQAALSGLILGAGLLFRIDNILALPVFAILTILYARRMVPVMLGGALGMAPALVAMALMNLSKFGTLNPLSYGIKAGGGTNLTNYVPFGVGLVLLLGALGVIRSGRVTNWRMAGGVVGGGLCALLLLLPEARTFAWRLVEGCSRLIVDARGITSSFDGVVDNPDGTKSFWGLAKKALGQSVPWLGLLVLLLHRRLWDGRQREMACALIFCLVFMFPFLVRSWHGGLGSNMRYFLPVLPVVSILAALVLQDLMKRGAGSYRLFVAVILFGATSSFVWTMAAPTAMAGAHQMWSLYVFVAVLLASGTSLVVSSTAMVRLAFMVAGFGVGVSIFNSATDTAISQLRRANNEVLTDLSAAYDGKLLVYGAMLRSALMSPEQLVAAPQVGQAAPDRDLVTKALDQGYRILMPEDWARAFVETNPGYRWETAEGPVDLVELFSGEALPTGASGA